MTQAHPDASLPTLLRRYEQLLRETQAISARLAVVNEVSQAITATLDLDTILEVVVEQTKWALDYDRCRIALRDPDGLSYHQWSLYDAAGGDETGDGEHPLHEGLAGWVMRGGRPLRLGGREPPPEDATLKAALAEVDTCNSVLALPLSVDGDPIGALIFESRHPQAYDDADLRLGTTLAAQIATAIRNARLYEESQRRAERIAALNAITRAMAESLDIDEVFQTFAVQTRRLIRHHRMSIALLDTAGAKLRVYAVTPQSGERVGLDSGVALPVQGSAVGWVVTHGKPLIQPDTRMRRFLEDAVLLKSGIRSYLDVPLIVKGEVIGTLNVGCREPDAFGAAEVETLTEIANQVAIIIQNQRLHAETQRFAERLEERVRERTRELREVQAQLIEAERFAAAGRLAAAIAHEINNPMQSIRSGLELLARRLPEEDDVSRQYIEILLEEQARVSGIIRQMLDFYRPPQGQRAPTDVNEVIERVLRLATMDHPETQVETRLARDLPRVYADADQLKQVFLNLVLNAVEAMARKGRLTVTTATAGDWVVIRFQDEGPGIPAADRQRIFEPFYTTKPEGLGIGLSVSRSLIEAHGGKIAVHSREGKGTTFEIRLPAMQEGENG